MKGQGHETYLYGWDGLVELLKDVDPEWAEAAALDAQCNEV